MPSLGLEKHVVDQRVYANTVRQLREAGVVMPTFSQLAEPSTIPEKIKAALADVDPDSSHPLNLFRVHWYNDATRCGQTDVPAYVVLPESLTGTKAKVVVAIADRFSMIKTHKVLAAYACLAPRLITGQFDATHHRAIWPSTGNYCRGGVAISRILKCRGVAILPEGMSQERFDWLRSWTMVPAEDIIATPGTESNVKEIYDKCNELDKDPQNIIFNQFCEFGNHLAHFLCTGKALEHIFNDFSKKHPGLSMQAYISATGSGGTLAAGDYLKETFGSRIVAVEATECPTLLYNGFGEHNIQGIGDKHVPYIHNVMNTDAVAGVSDVDTDMLSLLFNTDVGRKYLIERRGVPAEIVDQLCHLGLSSICNILAAIKTAKYYKLGENDVVMTIATDSAAMYRSEDSKALSKYFGGQFDAVNAGEVFGRSILGLGVEHFLDMTHQDQERVFNLGYFTWVEQQGVAISDFVARRDQRFWKGLRPLLKSWDDMIDAFNAETGVLETL